MKATIHFGRLITELQLLHQSPYVAMLNPPHENPSLSKPNSGRIGRLCFRRCACTGTHRHLRARHGIRGPGTASHFHATEETFSSIKNAVRKSLLQRHGEVMATNTAPWGQKLAQHKGILLSCIEQALPVVTVAQVAEFCRYSVSSYARCLQSLDL